MAGWASPFLTRPPVTSWGCYVSPDDAAIERYFRIDRRSPHSLKRRFNVGPKTTVQMLMKAEDGALIGALLPDQYEEWINPAQTNADEVARMIADAQTDFVHYPVSTRVKMDRKLDAG